MMNLIYHIAAKIFTNISIYTTKTLVDKNVENGRVNEQSGRVNDDELSIKEKTILLQLHKKEDLTIYQLSISCKIAERTVRRILGKLSEKGFIRRVGSDKSGHWEIIRQ